MNVLKNRIDYCLERVGAENRPALVPYLTVGYPTVELTVPIATKILASGADMLELGIPFSDPLADGPTIQDTSFKALENGVTITTAIAIRITFTFTITYIFTLTFTITCTFFVTSSFT